MVKMRELRLSVRVLKKAIVMALRTYIGSLDIVKIYSL
jgi:hypothetical protein